MSKRGTLHIAVWIAGLFLASAISASIARAAGADDDWEVIEDHSTQASAPQTHTHATSNSSDTTIEQNPPAPAAQSQKDDSAKPFTACGEAARPAQEPYVSIIATLNQMWGSNAKIYESVAPGSPHAAPGGCIFYNSDSIQQLTHRWMGITDADQLLPMLYAINAHELGHIVHGDLTAKRAGVPLETKELEADRFAGYTLWRLNIKRFDATDTERYYQAVGDDFVGAQGSHGTGEQRTTAFQQGWDLARTGSREDSDRPAGGLD